MNARAAGRWLLRALGRVALATWFGGFTFYAAVVVPDLHETFGGPETGEVSRRVAVFLYAIGAVAVSLGWVGVAADRGERSGWRGVARVGLLAASTLLWVALVAMHRELGTRIDSGVSRGGFFPLHETYLTVFAVQWAASLGLLALEPGPGRARRGD